MGPTKSQKSQKQTTTYKSEAMWINWVTVIKCIWQGRITKLAKLIQVHIIQNKRGSQQEALSAHPASTCLTANQVFASCYKTYLVVETVLDNKADPPPPPV